MVEFRDHQEVEMALPLKLEAVVVESLISYAMLKAVYLAFVYILGFYFYF